jgi:hypothetical protein
MSENDEVLKVLREADDSTIAYLSYLTGLSHEDIRELGGVPDAG